MQKTATSVNSNLESIISKFEGTPMLVVGDLIVDHYLWGKVERISPEAPVVVVQVTEESKRPGGAGNVVSNLAELGAKVTICGVVGDDDEGRGLVKMLGDMGANVNGILVDRTRPTIVKTRVIAHAQQVVRVDRELVKPLAETYSEGVAAAVQSFASNSKGIVISDYGKGTICQPVLEKFAPLAEQGLLGLGKLPIIVDPKAPNFSKYKNATVIKPNRREAEEASGMVIVDRPSAIAAARVLLQRWGCEMVLITLGEAGMVLVSEKDGDNKAIEIETVAQEVYDVSGAGDTVSSVFGLALAVGASPKDAAELANRAAGIVVAEVGTVAVTKHELLEAVTNSRNA